MDLGLTGRAALVTGASAGIGRAIAMGLAREGARIAVTGRRLAELESLGHEITAAGGTAPVIVVHDALKDTYVESITQAITALGPLQILVNNAGGSRAFGMEGGAPGSEAWGTEAQWDEALTLNFTRHRQLTHRVLPQMIAGGWGRVINITGKSEPEGLNGAFCAKAAVTAWAKGLSRELGKHGITVNCIPPGRIMSDQIRRNYTSEYRAWQSEHEIPVGRYGEPGELADLAVFLASPRAGYITGAVLPVDGGLRRYQY